MRQRLICGQPGAPTKGFLPDWRLPAVRRTPICRDGKWPVPKKVETMVETMVRRPKERSSAITSRSRSGCARSRPAPPSPSSRTRSIGSSTSTTRNAPTPPAGAHPCRRGVPSTKRSSWSIGQPMPPHTKVRRDRIDASGCFTLRYRSKLHHVGVGRVHRGRRVLILVADLDVRVIGDDGVMLRHLEFGPVRRLPATEPGYRLRVHLSQKCATSQMVETMGLEPTTPCLQSRCSSQLSYVPVGTILLGTSPMLEAGRIGNGRSQVRA